MTGAAQTFDALYGFPGASIGFNDMDEDGNGGYFIVGKDDGKAWLMRSDHQGNVIWSHTMIYPHIVEYDIVRRTSDGGALLAGYRTNADTLDLQVELCKVDQDGQVLWVKSFGGVGDNWCNAMTLTADGGALIASRTALNKGYILRVNDEGDTLWTRVIGHGSDMILNDVCAVPGSTDHFFTGSNFSDFTQQLTLLRVTDTGELLATRRFDLGSSYPVGTAIIPSGDSLVIAGHIQADAIVVLSMDTAGNIGWAVKLENGEEAYVEHMVRAANGDLVLSCRSDNLPSVLRLSSSGSLIWAQYLDVVSPWTGNVIVNDDSLVVLSGEHAVYGSGRLRRMGPEGGSSCSTNSLALTLTPLNVTSTAVEPVILPYTGYVIPLSSPVVEDQPVIRTDCLVAQVTSVPTHQPMRFYPDPADGSVQLEHPSGKRPDSIMVFNSSGMRIQVPMATSTLSTTMDTRALANGIHLVRVRLPEGDLTGRFMVMH